MSKTCVIIDAAIKRGDAEEINDNEIMVTVNYNDTSCIITTYTEKIELSSIQTKELYKALQLLEMEE